MKATVVITTRNRKEELRVALNSCMRQSKALEIIVVDDASTDGTAKLLETEFPSVKKILHDKPTGYIVGRNEAASLASGDIIFSIDDDAEFSSPCIVNRVLVEFDDAETGAVAIPYSDVMKSDLEMQRAIDDQDWVCDRFVGTAYAVRRETFLKLGGFRECFFHQGEESDFCIRLLNAGYFVKLGRTPRINHYESPKRDLQRMDVYGRRNDLLFCWLNVPMPWLPLHFAATAIRGLLFGFRVQRPLNMLRGVVFGIASVWKFRSMRSPVEKTTYSSFRKLRKNGPMIKDDLITTVSNVCN